FESANHPQRLTHGLKIRWKDVVPVLLGPSLGKLTADDPTNRAQDMLILFKPWRNGKDLKHPSQSWIEAYEDWNPRLNETQKRIIRNMTVLSEGKDARSHY
ncbi:hypothetical protein BKA70DRAFT_1025739, partial [Coprinopsis sp. MPI-PUGE-AT-0042]